MENNEIIIKPETKKETIAVRLEEELKEKLLEHCEETKQSISEVVRKAIEEKVAQEGGVE